MNGRLLSTIFAATGLGGLGLQAGLIEIARATGGAAALLAPSPAASIGGLLIAVALVLTRVFTLVIFPALALALLGFIVTSAISAARRTGRQPEK